MATANQPTSSPSSPVSENPAATSGVHPKGAHRPTILPPLHEPDILRKEVEREHALLILLFYFWSKPSRDVYAQARQELRQGIVDLMEDGERKIAALKELLPHIQRIHKALSPHGEAIYAALLTEFKDEPKLIDALKTLRTIF